MLQPRVLGDRRVCVLLCVGEALRGGDHCDARGSGRCCRHARNKKPLLSGGDATVILPNPGQVMFGCNAAGQFLSGSYADATTPDF